MVPLSIFLLATLTVAIGFYGVWDLINASTTRRVESFAGLIDRGGIARRPQEITISAVILTVAAWLGLLLVFRPALLVGFALLPLVAGAVAAAYYGVLQMKVRKRLGAFVQQLELALRLISSGVRIGLGLKQSFAIVIDEMPDPARYEFMRVLGQTNIGISVYDALDDLAVRMPADETMMLARVVRVQSTTGGDLTGILEQLADTIKERRRIQRKIAALTSEGRMGALVLSGVPLILGLFICLLEKNMGHSLLFTGPGHITLGIVGVLEIAGALSMRRILKVKV